MPSPLVTATAPICRTAAHSCPAGRHPRRATGKTAFGTPGWLARRFRRSPPRVRVRSALGPAGTGSSYRLQQSVSSFSLLRSQCLFYGQKFAVNPCEKLLRAFVRSGLREPLRVVGQGRLPLGAQVCLVRPPNSTAPAHHKLPNVA